MLIASILVIQFTIMMFIFGIVSIATKDHNKASLLGWLSVAFGLLLAIIVAFLLFI